MVGSFTADDPNESNNHIFSLVDDAGGLFSITTNGALTYDRTLDFESVFPRSAFSSGTKTIQVKADDQQGGERRRKSKDE